jgi:hypothetical protein
MAILAQDPFGTAALRQRVLDAWAASPARFREDANAEDDLVRGGYRDRVVVELAQNAADAAARDGRPGRLLLTLAGSVLAASNTGAPLDPAGVESLSTLRASSKRDDGTVGRFGVGFSAVLAVSDGPEVSSETGAVGWDADRARRAVAEIDALADEAGRRSGQLPVLRLPWPSAGRPVGGFTTTVLLPLRDPAAVELVRRQLGEVDDALLLALPALTEITVEIDGVRRVVADAGRWRVVRRSGRIDPSLLADRPVEERDRPTWSLAWALPLAGQPVPAVLHAPTPTDEPLDLPALLIGSFPLDPTRRQVAPGPLTDSLVGRAASAYLELARDLDDPLALLPGPMPVGRLDGALREAVTAAFRGAPLLVATDGSRVAPRDATTVAGADPDLRDRLAEALGPLVPDHRALDRLGARRLALAEVVEGLADLDRAPGWWRDLYAALDAAGVRDPDVLAVLPVPLADGRLVRGPRGVLLPAADLAGGAAGLDALGLRLAHPDAVHPLLLRAGAAEAGARTVLEAPELRVAIEQAWDGPDPLALADTVLPLVGAASLRPGELPWLAALPLPDEDGEPAQADELVVPGSVMAGLADRDQVGAVSAGTLQRWGRQVLAAVGALDGLAVTELEDVVLEPGSVEALVAGWAEAVLAELPPLDLPPSARTLLVLPDLDLVAADRWPEALRLLSADPQLRAAVVTPVRLDLGDGQSRTVPSYASWLLRTRAVLGGRSAAEWAAPGAGLTGVYDELGAGVVDGVDPAVLSAAGVRTSLAAVLAAPGGADDLLGRLADDARTVPAALLATLWPLLATVDPRDVTPPARLRVDPTRVVDAAAVVVADRPEHLQLRSPDLLVVPLRLAGALAEVLDLDRSSDVMGSPDLAGGSEQPVPASVVGLVPGLPTTWWEHDDLLADGRHVSWWRGPDGRVHAATVDGLARGLAAAAGRWETRLLLAAVLADPVHADDLRAETRLEG